MTKYCLVTRYSQRATCIQLPIDNQETDKLTLNKIMRQLHSAKKRGN